MPSLPPQSPTCGSGHSTYNITSGGSYIGTPCNDKFIISSPTDVNITGNGGSNIYVIYPSPMTLDITDFDQTKDTVQLVGFTNLDCNNFNITT